MPTVLETAKRKARKEHRCDFCGLKIEVGEIYEDQTAVYDGELYHWKSHFSCKKLARELNMYDYCDDEGLTADAFQEYVDQYLYGEDIHIKPWSGRIAKAKELLLKEGPHDERPG